MGPGWNYLRVADRAHFQRFPLSTPAPGILHPQFTVDMIDLMLHRQGDVIFAVKSPRNESNRPTRHKLANKNHAPSPGIRRFLSNIESQVHFLEIAMQRNRQTKKARVEKQKPDHAKKCFAIFEVDLGSRRDQGRNDLRIDSEVEQG